MRSQHYFVFSRPSLLFLMKQAALWCSDTGRRVETDNDLDAIGRCILSANDLIDPRILAEPATEADSMAELMAVHVYFPQEFYLEEYCLNEWRLEEVLPSLSEGTGGHDLIGSFKSHTGMTYRRFG